MSVSLVKAGEEVYMVYLARTCEPVRVVIDTNDEPYNAGNLQEVIDRAVDHALASGWEGLFFDEGDGPDEFEEDFYFSAEHGRYLNEPGAPNVEMPDGRILGGM